VDGEKAGVDDRESELAFETINEGIDEDEDEDNND
jgi:hypothetical protein